MKQTPNHSQHGFTLIEIIGVLAIMSIMAATIAPSAIQMLTAGKQTSEDKALAGISDALRLFVQTNKQVPAATAALPIAAGATNAANVVAWDKAIGTVMNVPSTKVSTNIINKKRIYLYPADFIAASTPTPPLPYDQTQEVTNLNTAAPNNGKLITTKPDPRIMVISNMNPGVTLATASGSLTKANFDAIWNQSNIPNTYTELTEGDKLKIKIARINMTDLFTIKSLKNATASDPYTAAIKIDGQPIITPYTWAANTSIQFYLLTGSILTLGYNDATPTFYTYDNNVVSTQQPNFYYSSGTWGASQVDPTVVGTGIASITNSSGMMTAAALSKKANCVVANSAGLTIDASNAQDDYFVFEADASGNNIFAWDKASKGKVTFFGKTKPSNYTINGKSISKQRSNGQYKDSLGNTIKHNWIQTCNVVLVVPTGNPKTNVSFFMFYMPETQTTTPYEITIP